MQFTINYRVPEGTTIRHGALDGNIGKEIPVRAGLDTVSGRVVAIEYVTGGAEAFLTIEIDDSTALPAGMDLMRVEAGRMGMSFGFQPPPSPRLTDKSLTLESRARIAELFKGVS